jgi:hypothetical protein
MPKNVNTAKRNAADNKNNKVIAEALNGKEAIFGKVEKVLGNCAFQIQIQDPKSKAPKKKIVQGLIRGSFKGGSKSETHVSIGTFVILAPAQERIDNHAIIGVINENKVLKELIDAKVIPEFLIEGDNGVPEDIFDYSEVQEEEINLDDI